MVSILAHYRMQLKHQSMLTSMRKALREDGDPQIFSTFVITANSPSVTMIHTMAVTTADVVA